MKLNLIFLIIKSNGWFLEKSSNSVPYCGKIFLKKHNHNKPLKSFFSRGLFFSNIRGVSAKFFFLNKFIQYFLENFFKKNIILNIKKGSNKLILRQVGSFYFFGKFFKKNLKVGKQILGVLYYSLLLKDSIIFSNFFKKKFEKINIKLHKKLLLGLKKLIKSIFKPRFGYFGLVGIFLNIKGKLGVSGNAKKRRYFFYFGEHSITKRTTKFSHKQTNI